KPSRTPSDCIREAQRGVSERGLPRGPRRGGAHGARHRADRLRPHRRLRPRRDGLSDRRPATRPYAPTMPILEALMTLSYVAAVTTRVMLGTEVLVLPQRHPTLVAKQVSTLDTLSGGRVRLGVGVGWQESEYEALGENFATRSARMDEAIALLRAWWSESQVDFVGPRYPVTAMAMEPKPPQGRRLPVWIGGMSEPAWRRVGRLGDGWLASRVTDAPSARTAFDAIRRHAEAAGRDPATIGRQSMV